ncbi:MAG: ribonuclease D [Candidatus Mesenet longicola]|uniref:Ribonuclease D n=1 Tax=Candidatus Mesenet longicola TaxID=1892558 RepID=A0A8J3HXU1_9RICK|nr:MAG: ribonuclease D [Candidatus Mesenet longicola]GHM59536.1 MAG: ribonuclease D [Candidatus Mesenet longicola]
MLINRTTELRVICERLKVEQPKFIAVDTEFIKGNKSYYFKLCLIQVSCNSVNFVVDALSNELDLSPLAQLLLDTKIIKVFHGSRQDLEVLFTVFSKAINPIFDTQIAAMFCYYYENFVGYSKLVEQIKGVKLNKKKFKNFNWLKRPLSEEQIEYALNDVTHLYDLYTIFYNKLVENNRILWFLEEMKKMSDISAYVNDPQKAWRRVKFDTKLQTESIIAIKAICQWREILAQRYNINREYVVDSVKIASIAEKYLMHNIAIKDCIEKYIKEVLTEKDFLEFPKILEENKNIKPNLDDNFLCYKKSTLDILLMLLHDRCQANHISQRLVASKNEIIKSICRQDSDLSRGWRYEFFGKYVDNFVNGDSEIVVSTNKIDCKSVST